MIYSILRFLIRLSWSSKKPRRHRPYGRSTAASVQGSERAVGSSKADAPTGKENRNLDLLTEQSGILNNVVLRHYCEGGPTSGRCGLDHRIGHLLHLLSLTLTQLFYPIVRSTRHHLMSSTLNLRQPLLGSPAASTHHFPESIEILSPYLASTLRPGRSTNHAHAANLRRT